MSDEQPTESALKAAVEILHRIGLKVHDNSHPDAKSVARFLTAFAAEAVKAERERVLQVLGFARDAFDGSAHPVQWRESIDAVIAEIDAARATKEQAK
jgi:hypothetical protein